MIERCERHTVLGVQSNRFIEKIQYGREHDANAHIHFSKLLVTVLTYLSPAGEEARHQCSTHIPCQRSRTESSLHQPARLTELVAS